MGVRTPRPQPFPLWRLVAYVLIAAGALGALVHTGGHGPIPLAGHTPGRVA